VSVALDIQHAKRMRNIVICGPPGSTTFFHIFSKTAGFSKKIEHKISVLSFSTNFA